MKHRIDSINSLQYPYRRLRRLVILLLCLIGSFPAPATAQPDTEAPIHAPKPASQRIVLAFYNTENFFDTLPSPARSHDLYTPTGPYRWNSERYHQKVRHIAQVLDSLKADLVGLAEIENETVLRDLVARMNTSYNYLIRPGNDPRGINVALLYRGSQFFPLRTFHISGPGLSRPILGVQGCLQDDTLTLLIAHLPSLMNRSSWRQAAAQTLRHQLQQLTARYPRSKIILMGDLNMTPSSALARKTLGIQPWPETLPDPDTATNSETTTDPPSSPSSSASDALFTPFIALERHGEGSYIYRDRRYVYDYFLFNRAWFNPQGWRFQGDYGLFTPDFLFYPTGPRRGYPRRTFDRGRYIGGFSDHFPVWVILEK